MSRSSQFSKNKFAGTSRQSTVKLTGGFHRGRALTIPADFCHPMGERERLALFNKLSSLLDFQGIYVLDLFAGSGVLGLETLSRGAFHAVFVEHNPHLNDALLKNLNLFEEDQKCNLAEEEVIYMVETALSPNSFELIFADPPYDNYQTDFLAYIPKLLRPGGVFVLSHPNDEAPVLPDLKLLDTRKYAACHLSFYKK